MTDRDVREALRAALQEAQDADDFVNGMLRGDFIVPGIYRRKAFLARDQAVSKICAADIASRLAFMRRVLAVLDHAEQERLQLRGRDWRLRALIATTAARMARDGRQDEGQALRDRLDRILSTEVDPRDFVRASVPAKRGHYAPSERGRDD